MLRITFRRSIAAPLASLARATRARARASPARHSRVPSRLVTWSRRGRGVAAAGVSHAAGARLGWRASCRAVRRIKVFSGLFCSTDFRRPYKGAYRSGNKYANRAKAPAESDCRFPLRNTLFLLICTFPKKGAQIETPGAGKSKRRGNSSGKLLGNHCAVPAHPTSTKLVETRSSFLVPRRHLKNAANRCNSKIKRHANRNAGTRANRNAGQIPTAHRLEITARFRHT